MEGASRRLVTGWIDRKGSQLREDWIADETPVAVVVNGISQAVMMLSAIDLIDFAYGFCFTEGIVDRPEQIFDIEIDSIEMPIGLGLNLLIEISAECEQRLKQSRRLLAGRTGCGLCGKDSLEAIIPTVVPLPHLDLARPCAQVIIDALRNLTDSQPLQQSTGGTHAAAWFDNNGKLLLLREDIGRHNALDKLIGAIWRQAQNPRLGFVGLTSRASYEMVLKANRLGVQTLAAVSAPTSLAIDLAMNAKMTLAAFVRRESLVIYSGQLSAAQVAP